MIVEFYDTLGGKAMRVSASQVVVRTDDGTPLAVASVYGPDGAYLVETANLDPRKNEKFHRVLRSLGIDQLVIVDSVDGLPAPQGAKPFVP